MEYKTAFCAPNLINVQNADKATLFSRINVVVQLIPANLIIPVMFVTHLKFLIVLLVLKIIIAKTVTRHLLKFMEDANVQKGQLYTNLNKVQFVFHVTSRVVVSVNSLMFVRLVKKVIISPIQMYVCTVQLLIAFLVVLIIFVVLVKEI